MNECLYCQLEKSSKAIARQGYEDDFCDKHKVKFASKGNPLDYIDDGIDIEVEQDQIHKEIEEQSRKDYPRSK